MNSAINYSGFVDLVLKSDDDLEPNNPTGLQLASATNETSPAGTSTASYRHEILAMAQRRRQSGNS